MRLIWIAIALLCLSSANVSAGNLSCPDAGVFSGKLITHINWSTAYSPLRLGGAFFGNPDDAPSDRADPRPVCICFDNLGMPEIGTQMSYWEPVRMIEVVRNAFCSPTMGGEHIMNNGGTGVMSYRSVGGESYRSDEDGTGVAFYYYNYWAFPLMAMLDLFVDNRCSNDGWIDMDLMYVSGLDPTHESDLLSAQFTPEISLVARPEMQALCVPDAIASTVSWPINQLWWCAGTWGNLYPFTGRVSHNASPVRDTSLVATRALASLHRRGLARRTMGNDTMCEAKLHPIIPKTQYQMSMFYPVAEVGGEINIGGLETGIEVDGSHKLGESTFKWGEWRNIPGIGEDYLYILWRWNDCCLR